MSKTIRLIIDVDVSDMSDDCIESGALSLQESVLPEIRDIFKSADMSLPVTGHLEVITKYE